MNCEFNGDTGRCRKGPTMSKKCEMNPRSKRCRKKTQKKPRKPKHTPSKPKQTPSKPSKPKFDTTGCDPGKFRNPATNRCVSKSGPIGRKIFTSSDTTTIGGPVSLNFFEFDFQGVRRRILSLGDEHTNYRYRNERTVITLATFLKKIIRQSPHCIDLFVENAVYQRQKRASGKTLTGYSCPLDAVRQEFYGCPYHNFQGRKCPYENLRYHNWDMRFEVPLQDTALGLQPKLTWRSNPYDTVFFDNNPSVIYALESLPKEKLIRFILGLDKNQRDKEDMEYMFESIFEMLHITEDDQIASTSFQEYRKELIKRSFTKLKAHTRFPKNFLQTFIKVYKREIQDIYDFTTVFTDFYALCRIFQKYAKKRRGPKDCRDSERCEYMIFYAGDSHNSKINAFLTEMFGQSSLKYTTTSYHGNKKINMSHISDKSGNTPFQTVDELIQRFIG